MNSIDVNLSFVLKEKTINYIIPEESKCLSESIWRLTSFESIKEQLNQCRSLLNDLNLKEWSTHTSYTDISSLIKQLIEKRLQRKPLLLTRAWIKWFEILSKYPLIETDFDGRQSASLSTKWCLFLCECPGSFINCLNHYIISHFNNRLRLEWMANTLNPYYEDIDYTIIDDMFIKDMNCFKNWFFGSTNTGNILDTTFLADLQKEISKKSKFDLISCDGSVNCIDFPESQEEVIIPLLFREIIISVNLLKEKANLVVKCFTLFECQTICLLYLLCCAFDEIHVFKPTASKSGNSEVYLICIGFKTSHKLNSIISILSKHEMTTNSKAIFSRECLSQQFLSKVEECVKLFTNRQQMTIKRNLQLFKNMSKDQKQQIINYNKFVAKSFLKKYNVFSISVVEELAPNLLIDYQQNNCLKLKKLDTLLSNTNSYNERKEVEFFSKNWFKNLSQVLTEMNASLDFENQFNFKYWKAINLNKVQIGLVYGLQYKQIRCSKFCDLSLIISYNNCMKYSNSFEDIGKCFPSFSCETQEILKNLISNLETKGVFNRLISVNNSCHFSQQFSKLSLNENIELILDFKSISYELNSKNMFIINAFQTFSLELMHEKVVLNQLITSFCKIISFIHENDLLVIHISFSLTRLMSATLYLICRLFRHFSLVPCIGSSHNRHGLICLFSNKINDELLNSQIVDYFSLISKELNPTKEDNYSLVEIISVPLLISDSKFYETLFNVNSVQMMNNEKNETKIELKAKELLYLDSHRRPVVNLRKDCQMEIFFSGL